MEPESRKSEDVTTLILSSSFTGSEETDTTLDPEEPDFFLRRPIPCMIGPEFKAAATFTDHPTRQSTRRDTQRSRRPLSRNSRLGLAWAGVKSEVGWSSIAELYNKQAHPIRLDVLRRQQLREDLGHQPQVLRQLCRTNATKNKSATSPQQRNAPRAARYLKNLHAFAPSLLVSAAGNGFARRADLSKLQRALPTSGATRTIVPSAEIASLSLPARRN
ncbi:hypothetical protein B0H13DRAFT_1902181 [Mycena leptocephala]|nr:hypothetical protein B0H13DRAFT_1902181 [Mycena leptocephala]